jgi:hypothetical protein
LKKIHQSFDEVNETLRLLHDASGDIHRISTDLADLKKEIDGTAENMRKTKYKGVH